MSTPSNPFGSAAPPPEPSGWSGGTPPPAPAPAGGGRVPGWLIATIAAVVGIAVGIGAGILIFSGGGGHIGEGQSDAALACSTARDLPEELLPEGVDDPLLWEAQAVGALAVAAGYHDPAYQNVSDAGQALYAGMTRLDMEEVQAAVDDMLVACDTHGL